MSLLGAFMASSCRPRIKAGPKKGACSFSGPSYFQRLCAGGTSGALAISLFNPAEVIKTQVQPPGFEKAAHRWLRTHVDRVTMREVARRVWAHDGLVGFWAGGEHSF